MRSLILSQWRDLRIGVTREDLGTYRIFNYATACSLEKMNFKV